MRLDAAGGVNDRREAIRPVMAVACEAADALAIPAHNQPVAIMLDFMNPERAGWWSRHLRRQARFDEVGGKDHDSRKIGQRATGSTGQGAASPDGSMPSAQ
jgi:hypothetical protein